MYPTTGQTNFGGISVYAPIQAPLPPQGPVCSLTDELTELNNGLCELWAILQSIEVTVNGGIPLGMEQTKGDRPGLGGKVDSMCDTVREAIAVANRIKSDLG